MLRLNVLNVMKMRGILHPYAYLRKNGFSQRVAENLANGNVSQLKLDHIEKLCLLLICEPHDLLVWYPDKERVYPADNPLNKLRKQEDVCNMRQLMAKMPYGELKEVMKEISERKQ